MGLHPTDHCICPIPALQPAPRFNSCTTRTWWSSSTRSQLARSTKEISPGNTTPLPIELYSRLLTLGKLRTGTGTWTEDHAGAGGHAFESTCLCPIGAPNNPIPVNTVADEVAGEQMESVAQKYSITAMDWC